MIRFITFIFSFLVILLGLIKSTDLWWVILPISFIILNLIFPKLYILAKNRPIYFIYFLISFFRYVITPFLFILAGSSYKNVLFKDVSDDAIWLACFIMVGELLLATALINFFATNNLQKNDKFIFVRNYFLYFILFLGVLIVITYPEFLYRYNFILLPEEIFKPDIDFSGSGFLIIISDYILILPPLLLLNIFIPKFYKTKDKKYVFFSIFSLLPFLLFFKGTSRFSALLPAISWMILFIILLPEFKRKIIASIASTTLIVMISVSLYKQFGYKVGESNNTLEVSIEKLAVSFNAYFSGLYNVSYAIEIEKFYTVVSGLSLLVNDFLKNLAFFSSYVDLQNTSASYYNNYIYSNSGQSDQIIPIAGQSYLYFGLAGSLFMTFCCVIGMIVLEKKIYNISKVNYIFPVALAAVYFSLSMMVSLNSIYPAIFNFVLPFIVIVYINDVLSRIRFK